MAGPENLFCRVALMDIWVISSVLLFQCHREHPWGGLGITVGNLECLWDKFSVVDLPSQKGGLSS